MKVAIGLVVKGGEEFIDGWISCAERIGDTILVVDNGADARVNQILTNHPKVKQYHIQKDMGRNQSRDYQKILEMAREEDCQWVWNLDIDEYVPEINNASLRQFLINSRDQSISFPLFEMRGDNKHYVMLKEPTSGKMRHARACHKCYKVHFHLKFDEKDKHGISVPHNCIAGGVVNIAVQHFGHYTKELRDEKRRQYATKSFKDLSEQDASWMEDDDSKVIIKEWNKHEFLEDGKN